MSNENFFKYSKIIEKNLYICYNKGENMQFNLKNDVIFKAFFSRKGNEKYLLEFLEALLKVKIKK